jgi:cytochrome c peroxidase
LRKHLLALALLGFQQAAQIDSEAKQVAVEFHHHFREEAAAMGVEYRLTEARRITLQRLDYLLSDFALQSAASGKWIQSTDLAAYLSLAEGRSTADLGFVPAAKFTAIRFRIGVPPAINASDPHQFSPGHALNPLVNDLHWGWVGGYVFLALEGAAERGRAFSYHLANDGNSPLVTIPVDFDTTRDCTIQLNFDLAKLFDGAGGIDILRDGNSSHSREGDEIPAKLNTSLPLAISLAGVSRQKFQVLPAIAAEAGSDDVNHGTPFQLQITSRFPKVALPQDNRPTIEGVALGKALFIDTRLSKDNTQSCASCHDSSQAFADTGKQFSTGIRGIQGRRNAQPLFNLAWQDGFFWDGRAKTLREQVLMPIVDPHEMNADLGDVVGKLAMDESMTSKFQSAFGTPEPTAELVARSLEQFLLTLVSQDAKFDRAARSEAEFTPEEKRGLELFVTEHDPARNLLGADCFHCHGGNLFTSRRYSNNGLDPEFTDLGRFESTGDPGDTGKFKVPSLRNVAVTGPYMHDGRFETLEQVIDHYDHGVQRSVTLDPNLAKHPSAGLGLSDSDKRALVAFLKTLTDSQFVPAKTS